MPTAAATRVLVAIESRLYLEMLKAGLEQEPDIDVVGDAGDAESAIAHAQRTQAAVVLMSSGLPGFADGQAGCLLRDRYPACRIIVLADDRDQRLLADGLGCGASGYLTKDCSMAELIDTIRGVARGDVLIPPAMLGPPCRPLDWRQGHEEALLRLSRLSPRERQVLALVARGKKTGDIAEALVISPETARTHVQNTLAKLGVHSRLEAASFVIEHGLVSHLEAAA
jgi:two-component system nitrate/nitrite response regulator NarL